MKNQLLLFHAGSALCGPPNMMKYLQTHIPTYVWQLSLYGKTLHSYQTKPTDKDGGLEASRSYKGRFKSHPSRRMIGKMRGKREIREAVVKEE